MSLRSRLAATYAAMILIALLIFAAVAVFAIDRTLRSSVDGRLKTEAYAAASLADVVDGRLTADSDDRRQFLTLLSAGDDAAALDPSGKVVLSSQANPPADVLALASRHPGYYSTGSGDAQRRTLVIPILSAGVRAGTVIVWRASDFIEETDREAAVAFSVAAVIIALLAIVAGGAVTRGALDDAFARQRRFTADASHELRAPLAVIRAEADLALRKERPAAEYRQAMETVAAEADRMETLIGDLLSAARAESGAVVRSVVDVSQVAGRVAERLSSAAAANDVELRLQTADGAVVLGDPHALERALLAIAHNAVKYTPARGRVGIDVRRTGHAVEIRVRDTGPGFSAAALEHGLERFWRDDASRPEGGTGLGLAIARSIVNAAGGSISLANTPTGAEVLLRFPQAGRSD